MRRFTIGIVLVAAVVSAAVLAARVWESEEASGGLIEHRFCDLVFLAPPGRQSNVHIGVEYTPDPKLDITVVTGSGQSLNQSRVVLDRTGAAIQENYADTTAREKVAAIVATMRPAQGPPQWWPYTERTQYELKVGGDGVKLPDAGSGVDAMFTYGDGLHGLEILGLRLSNCKSTREVLWLSDAAEAERYYQDVTPTETGAEVLSIDNVQPEDQEAFDRFFAGQGEWHP